MPLCKLFIDELSRNYNDERWWSRRWWWWWNKILNLYWNIPYSHKEEVKVFGGSIRIIHIFCLYIFMNRENVR